MSTLVTDPVDTDDLPWHDDTPRRELVDHRWARLVLGLIPFAVGAGVWQLISIWDPPSLRLAVPTLTDTWKALRKDLTNSDTYYHIWVTLQEVGLGLFFAVVIGIALGIAMGMFKWVNVMLYPAIVGFQAIPKAALAPLMILLFGFGITSKVVVVFTVAVFPIMVGVRQGMMATRRDELDLMRSLRCSKTRAFLTIRVPRAIPSAFGGFQIAMVVALLVAIVAEFLGASEGLGYTINLRSARLDIAGVFSGLIILAAIGVILTLGLAALGARLSRWEEQ